MRAILDESDIASLVAYALAGRLSNTGNDMYCRFFLDKNNKHCLEIWTDNSGQSLTYRPDEDEDEPDLDNA